MEDTKQTSTLLESIKKVLMLDSDVLTLYEDFLEETIDSTKSELALLLEEEEVPESYLFIIKKVVIKRFNRRKNEGMKSVTTGESKIEFTVDDFSEYRQLIKKYVSKKEKSRSGVVAYW